MCGITGVWSFQGGGEELRTHAAAMARIVRHRGPDDEGVWSDPAAGIALGFRRLSIIDLSQAGAQPMISASGRYVIVFNGEVYNFERLREELGPHSYRGHSDTEVLLTCIEAWGLEPAVKRFIGMFAFALWDRAERRLSLVRDRLGIKPLYYALTPKAVAFASELRALQQRHEIDRNALALYARYGYVPAPWSIFRGIAKLEPGRILTIEASGGAASHTYWDAPRLAESVDPFRGSDADALDRVESLLTDSVRLRMIADVPLGVFLSSGIDSPLVTALMRREAGSVSTFTIGFEGGADEVRPAAAIARHLGTNHTEHVVTAEEALDLIPRMSEVYDEPLGDSSTLPTFLVSRLARQSVTVALSGDGGDEIFGGYHRYFLGARLAERVRRVPRPLRRPLGTALRRLAPLRGNLGDRLRGLGSALLLDDPVAGYLREMSSEELRVIGASPLASPLTSREEWPRISDPTALMMFLDTVSYLRDDILTKVDRASMAVSLEVREPLLDHRLVELGWSLPLSMKLRHGKGKWILRQLLRRHLPDPLIDQGKHGFGLPLSDWLKGPLRDWAESLLDPARIEREGFFDPASLRRIWQDGPRPGSENAVWRLLIFQQWLEARVGSGG
ncbi:MAG: asparagine synthase (glutamine-hydrolyzing) [Acidobacteriota bacterium]